MSSATTWKSRIRIATRVPPEYHRRQTVKNAERYVTPALKEYEEKVLSANEKANELEYDLFVELRDATAAPRGGCGPRPTCSHS